jgi:hypothetical protein
MPDAINVDAQNAAQANQSSGVVAPASVHAGLTPWQMDEIYDRIPDAEWEKFRGFERVAIGRRVPTDPYCILLGFASGPSEELADLYEALPDTAYFFVSWHRDVKQAAVGDSE